ncbi:MAG: hypothetical protein U0350_08050 [Caldilineaceae bacterium]
MIVGQIGKMKLLFLLLTLGCLTACSGGQAAQNSQATVAALSTENARLTTAVATLAKQPDAKANAVVAVAAVVSNTNGLTTTPSAAPTRSLAPVKEPAPEPGPLPNVLAEIPLAPQGAALVDFLLDATAGHLYVTDNAGHLYILDAANHTLLATLPAGGALTLDDAQHRLYVAPADSYPPEKPAIAVIDTQTLTVTATITGASHLALDAAHHRLFVGNRLSASSDPKQVSSGRGVRILNEDTLAQIAEIPQVGIPVYNPIRNELLIVGYTIYTADPDKAVVKQDLLPEISAQPLTWCNGCKAAFNAYIFPQDNLLAFDIQTISVGKGAGLTLPPRFLKAEDLTPIEKPADIPVIQPGCGSQKNLLRPVNGRIYRSETYDRYVFYNNLLVEDTNGQVQTWREGLEQPFINAQTNQAYANGWALDLNSLNPIGQMPMVCLFHYDAQYGVFYGSRQGALVELAERGGQLPKPTAASPGALPEKAITKIAPSPNFAQDNTLFLLSEASALYRSTDGGQQWTPLRNGLPLNTYATLSLALSPDFAHDHTLFTGGYIGDGWGEGVLRSTNGGDSWQPMWNNLTTLRVYQLTLSPNYATDGALLAYAHYTRLTPMETGVAVQRSTDRGVTWSLALTTTDATKLPPPSELLGVTTTQTMLPLRIAEDKRHLERTTDGGATWSTIDLKLAEGMLLDDIAPSPGYPTDGTLYILGDNEVWRATGNGATIQPWDDRRLRDRTFENKLASIAISPLLSDGHYRLFIGTNAGEFWTLDPAQVQWQAPVAGTEATAKSAAINPVTSTAQMATATPPVATPQAVTATKAMTANLVAMPSPTPSASLTSTPPPALAGEPPAGLFRPAGTFDLQWTKDTRLQQALGWAKTAAASNIDAAVQTFEQGTMIWRSDTKQIYVIYANNTWAVFDDRFKEGQTESDPSIKAPQGRLQPIRGFGKVWREHGNVRNGLGWATAKEQGISAPVQTFAHGFMIRTGGLVYALVETADGKGVWY